MCYYLSKTVGRSLIMRFFPDRLVEWQKEVRNLLHSLIFFPGSASTRSSLQLHFLSASYSNPSQLVHQYSFARDRRSNPAVLLWYILWSGASEFTVHSSRYDSADDDTRKCGLVVDVCFDSDILCAHQFGSSRVQTLQSKEGIGLRCLAKWVLEL